MKRFGTSVALLAFFSLANAQQPIKDFHPSPAIFPAGEMTLSEMLAALEKQTGNVVSDRRMPAENVKLTLPMRTGDFWPTMDALGAQTGIGFSTYGGVTLINGSYRKLQTSYNGLFRCTVKRLQVSRDDESQTQLCMVTLDVAWEPRFEPFYLNLDGAEAKFAPDAKGKILTEAIARQARGGSVAGSTATEIEVRMNAPQRSSPALASLMGRFEVIGPPKMLEFTFAKLARIKNADAAPTLVQEGVTLRLPRVEITPTRWSVDVEMAYPPGALVSLESFQADSWRANNRVWLRWGKDKLEQTSQSTETSKVGTKIRYNFVAKGETPLPPQGANVTLTYRTPSRVVAFSVPFAFRDMPLP